MDALAEHLHDAYGVTITGFSELDHGVRRVQLADGGDCVARVFPAHRATASVDRDATVLRQLEAAGFPAERLAAGRPVTTFGDRLVLVTRFIRGERPRGGRAWAILDELHRLDDGDDLPHALVHPAFVPVNAIDDDDADPEQAGRGVVVVDWTGAGRGPRVWSLAFTLWAGGARELKLVDAVISRYRRRITPEPEELQRLAAVIRGRPLLLDCWRIGHQGHPPSAVVAQLPEHHRRSGLIADRARRAFTH
jgi:hypothetical protein